jgi:hypothetical protein
LDWRGRALWRVAFGAAEGTNVDAQGSDISNERVAMHAQSLCGPALIPVSGSERNKNELSF